MPAQMVDETDDDNKNIKPIPPQYRHIDFYPNDTMRDNARRGLELRDEFGRGGTSVGIARGKQIAEGREILPPDVLSMYSYFRRHEVDKREGWGDPSNPTNGYIAWMLWGGDAGYTWATARREQMIRADEGDSDSKSIAVMDAKDDLSRWQRKALNAMKSKNTGDVSFVSDAIPEILHVAISAQLEDVRNRDEIKMIFDSAMQYFEHDHAHDGEAVYAY
jgi:hypothetical protein